MFAVEPPGNNSALEEAIDAVFSDMTHHRSDDDAYSRSVDQLTKLYKLKEINPPKQISPDTLVIVVGNLLGIILIVGHERMNVVTSKALNFILKLR